MSKDQQNQAGSSGGGDSQEVAALRRQLEHQSAELQEMRAQMQAFLAARTPTEQQQTVINFTTPDRVKEDREKFERFTAESDARHAKAEQDLLQGPSDSDFYRICILAPDQCQKFADMQTRTQRRVHITEIPFNPLNPWRVVAARSANEAVDRYNRHFGITGLSDGARHFHYECDPNGQPLEPVAV